MKKKKLIKKDEIKECTIFYYKIECLLKYLSKKMWLITLLIFIIIFSSILIKINTYENPKITVNWKYGIINLYELIIATNIVCLISFLSVAIYDAVKNTLIKTSLEEWIKKIAKTYFYIILIFALFYTYVHFEYEYENKFNTIKYYIPQNYEDSQLERQYVKEINYRLLQSKANEKKDAFNGIKTNMIKKSYYIVQEDTLKEVQCLIPSNIQISQKVEKLELNYKNMLTIFCEFIYFSVITIVTVGYGDIIPVSLLAKFFCCIELLVGQFILIVSIGRAFSGTGNNKKSVNK